MAKNKVEKAAPKARATSASASSDPVAAEAFAAPKEAGKPEAECLKAAEAAVAGAREEKRADEYFSKVRVWLEARAAIIYRERPAFFANYTIEELADIVSCDTSRERADFIAFETMRFPVK